MDLDAIDKRILRAVQSRCTLSAEELSELCGASPSTALRRLKRLRDERVIVSEIAVVDPKKVGRPLAMIVGVRLDRDDANIAGAFIRRMREHRAVTQCYFVTGAADYVIHLAVADMDEFDEFVRSELISDPHVEMTATSVVIKPIKVGLGVPIGD